MSPVVKFTSFPRQSFTKKSSTLPQAEALEPWQAVLTQKGSNGIIST